MDKLREYIDYFFKLTDDEWNELCTLFTPYFYQKGDIIYALSENSKGLCFITEGAVRSYKLTSNGKDYTWGFYCLNNDAIEQRILINACMVDYATFIKDQPSDLTFEVLLDTSLQCISKEDLETLYSSSIRWQGFARVMAEDAYYATQHRAISLLTKTAKERLSEIERLFPEVFERNILLDHIASYIGITRQTLNRLRKESEK